MSEPPLSPANGYFVRTSVRPYVQMHGPTNRKCANVMRECAPTPILTACPQIFHKHVLAVHGVCISEINIDMSDLRRQRALEWRRQRYRERRRDETTEEKERRLQSERRRRLLGESAEAKEVRLERRRSLRRECRTAIATMIRAVVQTKAELAQAAAEMMLL